MGTIRVNSDSVYKTVKELRKEAEECASQSRDARKLADQMTASWQGDAANEMMQKLEAWISEQNKQVERINKVADEIYKKAKEIEEIDIRLAKENAFGGGGGTGGFR